MSAVARHWGVSRRLLFVWRPPSWMCAEVIALGAT
ncbi:hypothetical protein [Mesorhizobium sp. M0027]